MIRVVGFLCLVLCSLPALGADSVSLESADHFEKNIRPLLIDQCYKCHSAESQSLKGDFRLDHPDGLLHGSASGKPAIVPGDAKKSRLIEAVKYGNPDFQMPPKHRLSEAQVTALETWINLGAPDPRPRQPVTATKPAPSRDFWSFKPPQEPKTPDVKNAAWCRNAVDRFVLAKLEQNNLKPSPEADRRTLIRRASYDLLGIAPSAQEVDAFVADPSPDAYDKLIERLLASPHYGERWGRYWLDLARYSDTKGYIYGREERQFVHANRYRDWVIGAMNADMPYDRFVMLQLAADQAGPADGAKLPDDLAAMGFLTVGRRFLGVVHDIIDDRIDVIMRTTQGLTVACARCHDHKFDPIPTADYYSLYGVFAGSTEKAVRLDSNPAPTPALAAYEKGLAERTGKLNSTFNAKKEELLARLRLRVGDYLAAVPESSKLTDELFYVLMGTDELNPVVVRQWVQYLFETRKQFDPIWAPWHALATVPEPEFSSKAPQILKALAGDAAHPLNPKVAAAFSTANPTSMADVAKVYGKLLSDVDARWREQSKNPAAAKTLADPDDEALRLVLYGPNSPARVPAGSIPDTEWFFDEGTRVQLTQLQAEIDRWNINTAGAPPHALILEDRPEQKNPRIFKRGNPSTKTDEVTRHFISLIAGENPPAFKNGSGRMEVAKAIASKDNPLTARVMVNRIWMHHFGVGLVSTPSDFGTRSTRPSHPELLDWLSVQFMKQGWSMKAMHRMLMCSASYRQSSAENAEGSKVDPENRLLSRMNRTRLDFEAMRDSLLQASGELSIEAGGRPVDINGPRRSVYALVDRQFLPGVYRVFDFASPDLHMPQRSATTVPQQALFFMNASFVTGRARALAARPEIATAPNDAERIQRLYKTIYQRAATEQQVATGLKFIAAANTPIASTPAPKPPDRVASAWQYGFGEYDSPTDRLKSYTLLPHFTGQAWQGGTSWPDGKLGWVQLTATGGHAGNDLAHAAVRRWVAPRDIVIRITSEAKHEYAQGDGITARIVSSRTGTLGHWALHNTKATANVDRLELKKGDTIDFVIDFAKGLAYDMFTWSPLITALDEAPAGADLAKTWLSANDFATSGAIAPAALTEPLSPWAMYAHVLLLSNEFVFVD